MGDPRKREFPHGSPSDEFRMLYGEELPSGIAMNEYRKLHAKRRRELWAKVRRGEEPLPKITNVQFEVPSVDMGKLKGKDNAYVEQKVDAYYGPDHNSYTPLIPEMGYPPFMIDRHGKDYALNSQGIYYRHMYNSDWVTCNRELWVPTLEDVDWNDPAEEDRRQRACTVAQHALHNETYVKSEFAWEADAWSDVFKEIRDNQCLAVDKRDCWTRLLKTDPVLCTLTGESVTVKRIPDATFGLATFSGQNVLFPQFAPELCHDRLQKLMLHRKCGLLTDPKWGETDLVFPFMAYEAKGWSGDCREARRQACSSAAVYLDMLDNLVRRPGPMNTPRPYQSLTSHKFQVFALTSFGAHWHVLVGYRRPRLSTTFTEDKFCPEYGGRKDMSENVYYFQKLWSGRVVELKAAWQLLKLIDQIHLWAFTDFRTFVLEHLRPWHKFCEDNYLLDWDSQYDCPPEYKRRRVCNTDRDLLLPCWVDSVDSKVVRQQVQTLAKYSLAKAIREHESIKGKFCHGKSYRYTWTCLFERCEDLAGGSPECPSLFSSDEDFLQHLVNIKAVPERAREHTQTQMLHLHEEHDMEEDTGDGWLLGINEVSYDDPNSHAMDQRCILAGKCTVRSDIMFDVDPLLQSPERNSCSSEVVEIELREEKACTKRRGYDDLEEDEQSGSSKRPRCE